MCFSAAASFVSGIALTGVGIVSLRKSKEPKQNLIAGIPFVFGIQQITEGILWLSLKNPSSVGFQVDTTYMFLIIGQVLWPLWLPLSFILFEKEKKRKNIMKIFLATGLLVALYFSYCLIKYNVGSSVLNHHIFYDLDFPKKLIPFAAFFYVVSTVGPPMFSSNAKAKLIGVVILLFYIVSRIFFQPSLISVWCFFSAVIGILTYLIIHEESRKNKEFDGHLTPSPAIGLRG